MVGGRSRRVCWPASVGRIFKAEAGYPEETPWMWKIVFMNVSHQEGELGGRVMIEQREHAVPTVASPKPKHSVVVSGHKTSVSLEEPFWQALREIATTRGLTVRALISLVDEKREQGNLSSALRVAVLEHFRAACQKETKA
jgi:predicted DNA-binding ribbon-helix-helix protein